MTMLEDFEIDYFIWECNMGNAGTLLTVLLLLLCIQWDSDFFGQVMLYLGYVI